MWPRTGDRWLGWGSQGLENERLDGGAGGPLGGSCVRPSTSCQPNFVAQISCVCNTQAQPPPSHSHGSPLQWQRACATQRVGRTPRQALALSPRARRLPVCQASAPQCVPPQPQAPLIWRGLGQALHLWARRRAFASIRDAPPVSMHGPGCHIQAQERCPGCRHPKTRPDHLLQRANWATSWSRFGGNGLAGASWAARASRRAMRLACGPRSCSFLHGIACALQHRTQRGPAHAKSPTGTLLRGGGGAGP